jgi:hypothetical protein
MTHFSDGVRVGRSFTLNGSAALAGGPTSPIFIYDIVPATLDADGIAQAQAVAGAGNLTINGALASGGVATFDVPRGVSVTSSNGGDTTQTATVYGTDAYGVSIQENIAFNGAATISGKKAFKTVTRVAISAALAGNGSAGTTDVLGLPYVVSTRNYMVTFDNGAQVTNGTFVAADATTATATTGDVRGTFDPNTACNGTVRFTLWMFLKDTDTRAGLYGVTQFNG